MIAPEVWKFPPPPCSFQFEEGDVKSSESHVKACITNHSFNHSVSVVLPDTVIVPPNILNSLSEDSDYYKIMGMATSEFIQKEFIDAFVTKGKVHALSIHTNLDTDDCVCVTPSGHLVLSLNKVTYEELGIEGRPSSFCRQKTSTRNIVTVDLQATHFKPGKNNYERIKWCLTNRINLNFDFIVTWDPPDTTTCPSSIAAYFSSRGYKVDVCHPQLSQRRDVGVLVPHLEDSETEEILEWLGAYSIQADLTNGSPQNDITTYMPPVPCDDNDRKLQVAFLQWSGYFSPLKVLNLLESLEDLVENRSSIPWISLHVQGFEDCPVSWKLQENYFTQSGENSYTIFIQPDKKYVLCKALGCQRKSLTRSRQTRNKEH